MPFASQQAGGRIQTNPAGARNIDLGPGVQVSEIHRCSRRAIQGFEVRHQLDQIPRSKARRQAAMAQGLHQQPSRITAGAGFEL